MSRIPSVKTWRVSYYTIESKPKRKVLASCLVDTINKRFAKWLAHDLIGYPLQYAQDKPVFISVSVCRGVK